MDGNTENGIDGSRRQEMIVPQDDREIWSMPSGALKTYI